MKKIIVLVILFALCCLAAKPVTTPMHVTYECREVCGVDCMPCDDCIGADEQWGFVAEGALNPSESFTYYPPYSMCHSHSEIDVMATVLKGNGELLIRLDMWEAGYRDFNESTSSVCMVTPTWNMMEKTQWSVTVTNIGRRPIRNIYLRGEAYGMTYADANCDDPWGFMVCPVQSPCP